jgi:urease accessory protein
MSRTPPILTRTRIPTVEVVPPAHPGDVHTSSHLMRLLHLASPALPVGAFHFSQGLEYAVEAGWVHDEVSARDWIGGVASASLGTLDLPVLHRLHAAWSRGDDAEVMRWNAFLIASRETMELRAEDRHMGSALLRVLAEFELKTSLFGVNAPAPVGVAYATAFSFACVQWRIGARDAVQTLAWAWLENQVLAAVKLVPLGQSAGQRILHTVSIPLTALCERSGDLPDSDIGISTAASAIASGRHESQYTRLFRS